MAHQPAMRPSDAVAIAGKPCMDERLAEARQPVGPGTDRVAVAVLGMARVGLAHPSL